MDDDRIGPLYWELHDAFPHPFDWMGLLEEPPFWWFRWRKARRKVVAIFEKHGFTLTPDVARGYFRADGEPLLNDCGGTICQKLSIALDGQRHPSPERSAHDTRGTD